MDLNVLSEIDLNELTAQTAESSIDENGEVERLKLLIDFSSIYGRARGYATQFGPIRVSIKIVDTV